MNKITILFFLLFGINLSFAECTMCAMSGIQFFPQQKEISMNSMFIIEGYARSEKTINSFENRKIYLESEYGELVELNLLETWKGQMSLTQAILKPTEELKPNTTYFLKYSGQTENESREMRQYNRHKKKHEKVFWKTTNEKSIAHLNSSLQIKFQKTKVIHYGCGPSANAIFEIKNKSESEIWYKTEVVNLANNKKTTYYIKEWNGKLTVGHGMCSGAFTYSAKGMYKVRFTPLNIDGKTLKNTEWTVFESPFKNDKSGF